MVCAPHGLLLVGGYLTGLLREKSENREKRSALRSEVLREKRSNPSARAIVESGVWKKIVQATIYLSAAMHFEQKQSKTKCEQRLFEKRV